VSDDPQRLLVAAYRRSITPNVADQARIWARLGEEPVAPPTPWRVRVIACAAASAIVAAAVVLSWRFAPALGTVVQAPEGSQSAYDDEATPGADARRRERETRHGAVRREETPQPMVVREAKGGASRPRDEARRRAAADDPLRAELRLIDDARAALDRGDPAAALKAVASHRRRFPDGALVPEARALRAIALCEAGRMDEGRTEAAALLRAGGSPYDVRLRDACRR